MIPVQVMGLFATAFDGAHRKGLTASADVVFVFCGGVGFTDLFVYFAEIHRVGVTPPVRLISGYRIKAMSCLYLTVRFRNSIMKQAT